MSVKRTNSAFFLLLCFLYGSIVVPIAHELCHVFYVVHTESLPDGRLNIYPDFLVNGDQNEHIQDGELNCQLCAFSFNGVYNTAYIVDISVLPAVYFDESLSRIPVYNSSFSIRGPPVHIFL